MKNFTLSIMILICTCGNLAAQVNLDSALVAYWPFNGNANDESGHGNNGTVYGASLTTDRFGQDSSAYKFDGINDHINIASNSTINFSGPISISVWINPKTIQTSGNRMILGKSDYSFHTNYILRLKPIGYLQWEYNNYNETIENPLVINKWYHLVLCQVNKVGYNLFNLILAASFVNRQSTLACLKLR